MRLDYYGVSKGRASQWEVWKFRDGDKYELEKVCDWKYQADALARRLNRQTWEEMKCLGLS